MAAVAISSSSGEDLDTLVKQNNHMAILRYIRSHQLHEPHLVIQHGKALLPSLQQQQQQQQPETTSSIMNTLSVALSMIGLTLTEMERLAILEQVFISALDINQQDLADRCLDQMKHTLHSATGLKPDTSIRIRRLIALQKESQSDYDGAVEIYNALLDENPSNSLALKRKYAVLKAQVGKEVEAMEALNTYLSYNQGDAAAWYELSNLCMMVGNYSGATYCYEELVLMQPQDASLHCKLGELYVTTSGSTLPNLILARKHIALSLELSGGGSNNLRALYALVDTVAAYLEETFTSSSTSNATSNSSTAVSKKKKGEKHPVDEKDIEVAKALLKYGVEMILKLYRGTPMFTVVKHVMDEYSQLLRCDEEA